MFGMFGRSHRVRDLTPAEVAKGIAEGRYLLVDVREMGEIAAEAFPDAVALPMSSFTPARLPDGKGKELVFACRTGQRSMTASMAVQTAGLQHDAHLAGGIFAWKMAGLPTKRGG